MNGAIRDAVVVLGAQVELPHRRQQSGRPSGTIQRHRQLLSDPVVPSVRCRVHMQDPFPHLVAMIEAEPPTTLKQRVDLRRMRVEHQRSH